MKKHQGLCLPCEQNRYMIYGFLGNYSLPSCCGTVKDMRPVSPLYPHNYWQNPLACVIMNKISKNRFATNQEGVLPALKLDYMLDHMPDSIRAITTQRTFAPGEAIVRKGDEAKHVYLLTEGNICVSTEFASGQRYNFGKLDVPDLIGDLEVLAGQPYFSATCEARTTCHVIAMTAATFLQWMRSDATFALAVAQLLAAKMYPTSQEAGLVKFLPSLDRFESYLLKCLGDVHTKTFVLHTSRQQIADDIGTSVKTVNRSVAKLRDDGLISLVHGKIVLNEEQQALLKQQVSDMS